MDSKDLRNIMKDLFTIRSIILHDDEIRKLLYYDTPDALDKAAPPISALEVETDSSLGYVTLFPIMEKGVVEYERNTFIQITLPTVDTDIESNNKNIYAGVLIMAITDFKHYMLKDDKIRLLEIINRVIKDIDNKKLNAAGKLEVIKVEEVIFDNYVYGFSIKIVFSDLTEGVDF